MSDKLQITVNAKDDLLTRAEKIVRMMGFEGAVGGYVINIYRLLQAYEQADAAEKKRPMRFDTHTVEESQRRFETMMRACVGIPPADEAEAALRKEISEGLESRARKEKNPG